MKKRVIWDCFLTSLENVKLLLSFSGNINYYLLICLKCPSYITHLQRDHPIPAVDKSVGALWKDSSFVNPVWLFCGTYRRRLCLSYRVHRGNRELSRSRDREEQLLTSDAWDLEVKEQKWIWGQRTSVGQSVYNTELKWMGDVGFQLNQREIVEKTWELSAHQ